MEQQSNNRMWWIIAAIVAAVIICICCVLVFGAAYIFIPRSSSGVQIGIGPSASLSESIPAQQIPVESPGRLVVESNVGQVEVRAGAGDQIVVEAQKEAQAPSREEAQDLLRSTTIATSSANGVTRIEVVVGATNLIRRSVNVDLTITVPPLTDLEINHDVGDVTISGVEGAATINLNVGDLSVNGAILSGNSSLAADVGSINFTGVLAAPADIEMRADVGTINLWLPADSAFNFEAETGIGNITMDFPLAERQAEEDGITGQTLSGRVGNAIELQLSLHTGTGDIRVRQR